MEDNSTYAYIRNKVINNIIMDKFLAINKDYFGCGLKSIDLLIISQIEEFERNNCKCCLTNKQFSDMFGESESTIKRTLDKLEDLKIIKRNVITNVSGSNKSRQRILSVNNKAKFIMNSGSDKQGSNIEEARFIMNESKVHNDPIKDKEKNNKKENILAALDSANAVEDKWIPKDNISNDIFGSQLHTDVRVIEILKQEHEDYPHESADYLSSMPCFYDSNKEVIREYVETVLGIK